MRQDRHTACEGELTSLSREIWNWFVRSWKSWQHTIVEVSAYCLVEYARLRSPDDASSTVTDSWLCLVESPLRLLLRCWFSLPAGTPSGFIWIEAVDSGWRSFPVRLRRFRSSNIFTSWAVYLRGWCSELRWSGYGKSMVLGNLRQFGRETEFVMSGWTTTEERRLIYTSSALRICLQNVAKPWKRCLCATFCSTSAESVSSQKA